MTDKPLTVPVFMALKSGEVALGLKAPREVKLIISGSRTGTLITGR
jgi:hypothetical protein